jgi:hypothetical protein
MVTEAEWGKIDTPLLLAVSVGTVIESMYSLLVLTPAPETNREELETGRELLGSSERIRMSTPGFGKFTALFARRSVMPRSMEEVMLGPVYLSVPPLSTMPDEPGIAYAPRLLATPAFWRLSTSRMPETEVTVDPETVVDPVMVVTPV